MPFGDSMSERNCTRCLDIKPLESFPFRGDGSSKRKAWCYDCGAKHGKKYRDELKDKVFKLLGDKCAWPECEWVDRRALCLDHKNGDGYKLRYKKYSYSRGSTIPQYLDALSNPEKYQLLCANHNMIKAKEIDPLLRKGQVN